MQGVAGTYGVSWWSAVLHARTTAALHAGMVRRQRAHYQIEHTVTERGTMLSSMVRAWVEARGSRGGREGGWEQAAAFGGGAGGIWRAGERRWQRGTRSSGENDAEAGFGIGEKKFRVSMYTWARLKFRAPIDRQAGGLSLVKLTSKNRKKKYSIIGKAHG